MGRRAARRPVDAPRAVPDRGPSHRGEPPAPLPGSESSDDVDEDDILPPLGPALPPPAGRRATHQAAGSGAPDPWASEPDLWSPGPASSSEPPASAQPAPARPGGRRAARSEPELVQEYAAEDYLDIPALPSVPELPYLEELPAADPSGSGPRPGPDAARHEVDETPPPRQEPDPYQIALDFPELPAIPDYPGAEYAASTEYAAAPEYAAPPEYASHHPGPGGPPSSPEGPRGSDVLDDHAWNTGPALPSGPGSGGPLPGAPALDDGNAAPGGRAEDVADETGHGAWTWAASPYDSQALEVFSYDPRPALPAAAESGEAPGPPGAPASGPSGAGTYYDPLSPPTGGFGTLGHSSESLVTTDQRLRPSGLFADPLSQRELDQPVMPPDSRRAPSGPPSGPPSASPPGPPLGPPAPGPGYPTPARPAPDEAPPRGPRPVETSSPDGFEYGVPPYARSEPGPHDAEVPYHHQGPAHHDGAPLHEDDADDHRPAARERARQRSGRRPRRNRQPGLPGWGAIALSASCTAGAMLLDLVLTRGIGVFFGLCFVLTAFGVAAGIQRSQVFTAGVLPPLSALGAFTAIGLAAPDRLGTTSSVHAILGGLAASSWFLLAASAVALGTIAFRVALDRGGRVPSRSDDDLDDAPRPSPGPPPRRHPRSSRRPRHG